MVSRLLRLATTAGGMESPGRADVVSTFRAGVELSGFTGARRVMFKATLLRSSAGGVGSAGVVSTGPAVGGVGGVGDGASVDSVLCVVSLVVSLEVVSTVSELVVSMLVVVVSTTGVVLSSAGTVLASVVVVVVSVEAAVLPPELKKSSLQARRGASFGNWAQSSQT